MVWKKQFSTHTRTHTLTSHGAESIALLCVIVVGGTTPPHAITAPISGTFGVVASTVEEREVAQTAVGVSTSGYHNGCNREGNTNSMAGSTDFLKVRYLKRHLK